MRRNDLVWTSRVSAFRMPAVGDPRWPAPAWDPDRVRLHDAHERHMRLRHVRVTPIARLVHCSVVVSVLSTMVAGALTVLLGRSAPEGFWIQHTTRTSDRLEILAQRFDVTEQEIRAWNGLDSDDPLPRGKALRIRARKTPPPLQLQRVVLAEPTRWDEAAQTFAVDEAQLRAWNPRYRGYETRLPKRALLSLWRESGVTRYPLPAFDAPLPEVEEIAGGVSIGRPQIGRLKRGVRLPPSEDYEIQLESEAYGSSTTVWHLRRGLAEFRRASGYRGLLRVGSISQEGGRKLRGHASHQSGRDVDVRLPIMEGAPEHGQLYASQVDWHATWALVDALVRTGGVQRVFLEQRYHRNLLQAARRLGADAERIEHVMSYLLHAKGHRSHLHIRFVCAPQEAACKG